MKEIKQSKISEAVKALKMYENKKDEESEKKLLIENENNFFLLTVGLNSHPNNKKIHPVLIPVPNSIYKDPSVCLIMKDPTKPFKEALKSKPISPIQKVIGLDKLRVRYQTYESRRKLCSEYDLFICDERIAPMTTKLLGKKFINSKKLPIPIQIKGNLSSRVNKVLNSVVYHQGLGPLFAIKVGTTTMDDDKVVENIEATLEKVIDLLPGKWDIVQSINIKTINSPALPLYNRLPPVSTETPPPKKEKTNSLTKTKGDKKKKNKKMVGKKNIKS